MTIKTRLLARIGEFFWEKAVVDVLLKVQQNKKRLGPSEISRQAGIYRKRSAVGIIDDAPATVGMMPDAIASGVLNKLSANGKAQRSKDGWEFIEQEFASRHDDATATFDLFDFPALAQRINRASQSSLQMLLFIVNTAKQRKDRPYVIAPCR